MRDNDPQFGRFVGLALLAAVALLATSSVHAQAPSPGPAALTVEEAAATPPTAPVTVDGVTLFYVRGISAFPAEQRATDVATRITAIAADRSLSPEALAIVEYREYSQILAGNLRVLAVFDADSRLEGVTRSSLALAFLGRIRVAIRSYRHDREPAVLARAGLTASLATVALVATLLVVRWSHRRLRSRVELRYRTRVRDLQIHSFQLVRSERLWRMVIGILSTSGVVIALVATYGYLHYVLASFPWTRSLGLGLAAMVAVPLQLLLGGAIRVVPKLVFLAVLVVVTRYILRIVCLFFDGVANGTVTFRSFDPEWAAPTYRLARILVIAFAVVVAYPYVPGSQTDAFKGVTLFMGVIFSLWSSSLIGNLIAGYSMTYRRAFRPGDYVKIGQHVGTVESIRLLVTHIQTPKREEVVIPNFQILSADIVNYSTLARRGGLILHTTVGIGYETPWRQVEAMLLEAASRTSGVRTEPKPFALQTALGDFAVTYELNIYCDTPALMPSHYTALHRNILDVFNEYGVQIMTPAYEGDPDQPKVVPPARWYDAPAIAPAAPPPSASDAR